MSQRKRATVVILNPRDGRNYTSLKSAAKEVWRGAAEFRGGGLWLLDGTPRAAFIAGAVLDSIEATYDEAAGSGLASVAAVEGLPAIGDVVNMFVIRSRRLAA